MGVASLKEIVDLLVLVALCKEILLELIRIELNSFVSAFLQDLSVDSSGNVLIILDLMIVEDLILGWYMHYAELRVVSHLAQFPLSESLKIIIKSLLLERFKFLKFEDLSESVLVWQLSSVFVV